MRILFLILLSVVSTIATAEKLPPVEIRLVDPFIELHSGTSTSFPVYDVVQRGEKVQLIRRRTDWFEIRASKNRFGWAKKEQLEESLKYARIPPTWRDVLVDDYLQDKFYLGAAGGVFDGEGVVAIRGGYKTSEHIALEGSLSSVSGIFADSILVAFNVVVDLKVLEDLRPFFYMGIGRFFDVPDNLHSTDIIVITDRNDLDMLNAGLGAQYFLTEGVVIRAEVAHHTTLRGANRSDRFSEINAGISFFF